MRVFTHCTFCPQARQADGDAEDGANAGGDADAGDGENLDLVDGDGGDIGGLVVIVMMTMANIVQFSNFSL